MPPHEPAGGLHDPDPARGGVVVLSKAIPTEFHLDAAELVDVNLLARGAGDLRRIEPRQDGPQMDLRLHPRPVRGDEGDRSMVGFGLARTRDQPRSISRLMARGRHDILLPVGSAVLELHAHEHAGARQQARIAGVRVELLGVRLLLTHCDRGAVEPLAGRHAARPAVALAGAPHRRFVGIDARVAVLLDDGGRLAALDVHVFEFRLGAACAIAATPSAELVQKLRYSWRASRSPPEKVGKPGAVALMHSLCADASCVK